MALPQETRLFLENLYDHLFFRDLEKTRQLYEVEYPAITEKYYGAQNWPALEDVAAYYVSKGKEHQLIYMLYLELYFRHAFAHNIERVTWQNRISSWQNYTLLFNFLLESCSAPDEEEGDTICLPSQWLWDMFDEFVFQFQDTQRKKWRLLHSISTGRGVNRSDEECEVLAGLWDGYTVMTYLYKFVSLSRVNDHLKANNGTIKFDGAEPPLKLRLGYYAAVSLLRINNMLCDYGHALDCVQHFALGETAFSHNVPSCHTTLHYNVAFARMMCKDYPEAVQAASHVLYHATRNKQFFFAASTHTREAMDQAVDKLYLLVVLCEFLSPQVRLDEFVLSKVREAHRDKIQKLQNDPDDAFFEIFKRICPKFMSLAQFIQNMTPELVQMQQPPDILQRQASVFMKDIGHQRKTEQLLSFAKLYNNVSLTKLAGLMNLATPEGPDGPQIVKEQVRSELLSVRAMNSGGDFFVDEDSVHVLPQKTSEIFIEQYTKQNQRIEELLNTLRTMDVPPTSA